MDDYIDYTEEDFVLDHSFSNWVFKKNEADIIFWEEWLIAHPHKKETAERAGQFLQSLRFKENVFSDQDTKEAWQTIQNRLKKPARVSNSIRLPRPAYIGALISRHGYKAAAALVGILLVSVLVLLPKKTVTYQTAFGETKTILLPDSSIITLNANSTLNYHRQWQVSEAREVWLEGEAFLQIVKKPGAGNARFIVHTDKLNVEVLGTAFNVNSRRGKTKVVLNSGRVQLHAQRADKRDNVMMMPGEMVEFSEAAQVFTRKKVDPEVYSSWRNHKLYFADNSVQEIAQVLEDTYGLQISIPDPLLRERKLTGEIPSINEQTVLEVLSESLHIRIIKEGRKVTLQHK